MSSSNPADDLPPDSSEDPPENLSLFSEDDDDFWSGEDLERAYQAAVTALDHVEQEFSEAAKSLGTEGTDEADAVGSLNDFPGIAGSISPAENQPATDGDSPIEPLPAARIQPARIIEAALFVGGMPLTIKRLSGVLRDEFDRDFIERAIDELNLQYDDENRPYEIRLEEGGYRMALRPEFENVRNKSYGFGPKEVRLSQDALEVLALVAYRQPITKEEIEEAGKANPNGVLRQLLRREIIGLQRNGKSAKDVHYHTTPRFLQIFGLADLSELPRSEDLNFK